jgi:hypothetical protein
MKTIAKITTGLKSLDDVCNSLRLGDNVVWQVDSIADYRMFLVPFAEAAMSTGKRMVYFRFAQHQPLLEPSQYSIMYELDSYSGFESFSARVHNIIKTEGRGVYYAFDCLSDLQSAWATDLMIGNFFMITCPFLFELDTIAYFSLLRNSISFNSIARIRETTQLLIDVYNSDGNLYVHPLKVWNRYSPTMFFPHLKKGNHFNPITSSVDAARLIRHIQRKGLESTLRKLDYWDRIFLRVEDLKNGHGDSAESDSLHNVISRAMISRDERILDLARMHLTLDDYLLIKDRLIGTGFIGGKTVGMLLARKILESTPGNPFERLLEPHDSFYIGSDVFYSYIVLNGWWKLFMEHKTDEAYFSAAEDLHEKMLSGMFPDEIKEKFQQIIEYFGQSPIIVRSSSLLEDGYGNAFAGKYESYFLVNQGSPDERFEHFIAAVRKIYASTMNEDALAYRLQRGLDKLDEQMGLLVQRVSGSYHLNYYYPDLAGVGFSYNSFVWKNTLDPAAGMLRLVAGLGTRAVNRVSGDYPRIVALDDPLLKAHSGIDDTRIFSQHHADILNIEQNRVETASIADLVSIGAINGIENLAVRDTDTEELMRQRGKTGEAWIMTFDHLLAKTPFASDMRAILKALETAYSYPVDIEFTANFTTGDNYRINLLQCRPQQARWQTKSIAFPESVDPARTLLSQEGNFLGGSVSRLIRKIILIEPDPYSALDETGKYSIARTIGKLNRLLTRDQETLLIGPGRWGSTTPSLGVPVRFSEINNVSVLAEIARMRDDLIPELSYGTHFFQDLVETDIFYIAIFPDKNGVIFNPSILNGMQSDIRTILEDAEACRDIIRIFDIPQGFYLLADIPTQKLLCFSV